MMGKARRRVLMMDKARRRVRRVLMRGKAYLFIYLFSLNLKLTYPSLQLKPINVN